MKAKPCPFCGRTYLGSEITQDGAARRFECPRCGALGPFPNSAKARIKGKPQKYYDKLTLEAWNRRVCD